MFTICRFLYDKYLTCRYYYRILSSPEELNNNMHLKSFLITLHSILFLTLFLVVGCKRPKDSAISVDDKASLGTYYLDSFSASLSTVLVDSLPTSTSDRILVGYYSDPRLGTYAAASYIQFSLAGIDEDKNGREDILTSYTGSPYFDSLVIEMNHEYTYGDTTNAHIMKTYRLIEDLKTVGGTSYIYNGQAFAHETTALATNNIGYSTGNGANLRIKLDDALGIEFLTFAKNNDNRVATNEAFKTYFKGIALIPDVANTSVFGYTKTPIMKLYWHDTDNPTIGRLYTFKYDIKTDLFFNQIKNDRASTVLAPLKNIYQEINATLTNNEAFVLPGVELMTKIKFPYLNDIKAAYPNFAINKAELIIQPKNNTYSLLSKLPNGVVLYRTNATNIPGELISYTGTANPEIVNPVVDYESNIGTYYKFEVTDFVQDQLKTSFYNETALMLASVRPYSGNRAEKLVLDNNPSSYTIKLKLYLTIF